MKGGQKSVYIESITFILIYCKKKWYYKNLRVNQVPVHRKLNDKGYIRIQWLLEFPGGLVGFPDSSVGKESTCNAEDPGLIPGLGKSPGEGIDYPLQYSWASRGAQLVKNLAIMQKAWVWFLGWEDPLEKGKATHSSILAWRIPCAV